MRVENLCLTKYRVRNEYTGSSLAHKPVTSSNVYWRPIQGVWMYRGRDYRETSEDCQPGTQCPASSKIDTLSGGQERSTESRTCRRTWSRVTVLKCSYGQAHSLSRPIVLARLRYRTGPVRESSQWRICGQTGLSRHISSPFNCISPERNPDEHNAGIPAVETEDRELRIVRARHACFCRPPVLHGVERKPDAMLVTTWCLLHQSHVASISVPPLLVSLILRPSNVQPCLENKFTVCSANNSVVHFTSLLLRRFLTS